MPDAYLRAPVGATAQAMGGANTAVPAAYVSLWNPAALSSLPLAERRLALGAGLRSMGRTDGCVSLEFRIPTRIGVGLAALYRGDPIIDIYDVDEVPVGNGSYATLTAKLAISYMITRALSLGAGVGVFYQNLPATDFNGVEYAWAFAIGGIDVGVRYQVLDNWILALVARNFNVTADWQFATWTTADMGMNVANVWSLPPVITLASRRDGMLGGKPLAWTCDVRAYVLNGSFEPLDHVSAVVNNGFEWRRWDSFYLRCGIGDLELDGELARDPRAYFDRFWLGINAGFMADLSRVLRGLRLNYAISTGKAWSGVDQQLDVQYSF